MDKPIVLYRGMHFDNEAFQNFDFSTIPMPKTAIYNENGEKCVADGQEYGIYMCDRDIMAINYADFGKSANGGQISNIRLGGVSISAPHIGVLFKIDGSQIDIREPKLGVFAYHQVGQGKEWITDNPIPASAFEFAEIRISEDVLHPEYSICLQGKTIGEIKREVNGIIQKSNEKLQALVKIIENVPPHLRSMFGRYSNNMDALRIIFGTQPAAQTLSEVLFRAQVLSSDLAENFTVGKVSSMVAISKNTSAIEELSRLTGIPIESAKEVAAMHSLIKFAYISRLRQAGKMLLNNRELLTQLIENAQTPKATEPKSGPLPASDDIGEDGPR